MNLKLSSNLAIGLPELNFLKKSLSDKNLLALLFQSFGVLKTSQEFNNLRVIVGNGGYVGVRSGVAIDRNMNVISIPHLSNVLSIPEDGETRRVVIRYKSTTVEKSLVNIQEDGLITRTSSNLLSSISTAGVQTGFIDRLRGETAFPTKIRFPNSTKNTKEYYVREVISNTEAILNVGAGVLKAEENAEWEVVGSFTPGVQIDSDNKYPFEEDSYEIVLLDHATPITSGLVSGIDFVLARVTYTDGTMTIVDTRASNLLRINKWLVDYTTYAALSGD